METLVSQNWMAFTAHALVLAGVIVTFTIIEPNTSLTLSRQSVPGPTLTDPLGSFDPKCDVNFPLELRDVANFNVQQGLIAFFVITILAHFQQASDGFGTGHQTQMIGEGWNWVRWIEQALSASIMTFIVGASDATRDLPVLFCITLATMALQFNGLSIESILRKDAVFNEEAVIANTLSGWILLIAIFLVILQNFILLILDVQNQQPSSSQPDFQVPIFLQFIGPVQLFWYACFGLVQLSQIRDRQRGVSIPQARQESWQIFLSFAAKISLAAGIAWGFAFRQIDCPQN